MECTYISVLIAVTCLVGCGGGGGGAAVAEPVAVVPEGCVATEMSFQFVASAADEKELKIEKMVLTEAMPGAQFGTMQVTFRFCNGAGAEVQGALNGEWASSSEYAGHIFVREAVTHLGTDAASQSTVRLEAYQLKLRVDSTISQADGLAASREAALSDGSVQLQIDGVPHTFHAAGEKVHIEYRY